MNKKVTIHDIARETGLNITAVSRAFQKDGIINEEKRRVILDASKKLGYKPNKVAGSLSRKTITIGVIILNKIPNYSGMLIKGIKEAHNRFKDFKVECDLRVLSCDEDKDDYFISILNSFKKLKYNGVIYGGLKYNDKIIGMINELNNSGIPVVTLSQDIAKSARLFASMNNIQITGKIAAELLSKLMVGKRVAIFTGDLTMDYHEELLKSFREETKKKGLDIAGVYDTKDIPERADELIKAALKTDGDINGIYVSSANSIPVIRHISESSNADIIKIVTSDVFPELARYIYDGTVSATIYQAPAEQAATAFVNLYYHITENIKFEGRIMIKPQIVLSSNFDLYMN